MRSRKDDTQSFRAGFAGKAMTPGHPDYDPSRSVWNVGSDRKLEVSAGCTTAARVAEAIAFARGTGLEISVRVGGHNYAGIAVGDGGMMIGLGAMSGVKVY